MNFNEEQKFQKDFKKLGKKYLSLRADLQEFRSVISVVPLGNSKHFNVLMKNGSSHIVKARLFCRYLKGSSLRIIYAYCKETQFIDFIEIYSKSEKESEDSQRIKEYLENIG